MIKKYSYSLSIWSFAGRPLAKNYDNLNREELLYELEMALQDNEGLLQQLASKCRFWDSQSAD